MIFKKLLNDEFDRVIVWDKNGFYMVITKHTNDDAINFFVGSKEYKYKKLKRSKRYKIQHLTVADKYDIVETSELPRTKLLLEIKNENLEDIIKNREIPNELPKESQYYTLSNNISTLLNNTLNGANGRPYFVKDNTSLKIYSTIESNVILQGTT